MISGNIPLEINYDKSSDVAYIFFSAFEPGAITDNIIAAEGSQGLAGDIILDIDEEKRCRGLEIINASYVLPPSFMDKIKSPH